MTEYKHGMYLSGMKRAIAQEILIKNLKYVGRSNAAASEQSSSVHTPVARRASKRLQLSSSEFNAKTTPLNIPANCTDIHWANVLHVLEGFVYGSNCMADLIAKQCHPVTD